MGSNPDVSTDCPNRETVANAVEMMRIVFITNLYMIFKSVFLFSKPRRGRLFQNLSSSQQLSCLAPCHAPISLIIFGRGFIGLLLCRETGRLVPAFFKRLACSSGKRKRLCLRVGLFFQFSALGLLFSFLLLEAVLGLLVFIVYGLFILGLVLILLFYHRHYFCLLRILAVLILGCSLLSFILFIAFILFIFILFVGLAVSLGCSGSVGYGSLVVFILLLILVLLVC
ncbi:MAG: hypothetical protein ACLUKN_12105 [Bacilli bacterium]